MPYWAELWPSGIALARHVVELPLDGLRVLELGCGLGLPSLAAALAGAESLATDWAPEAVELLRANAARERIARGDGRCSTGAPTRLRARRSTSSSPPTSSTRRGTPSHCSPRSTAPSPSGGRRSIADPGRRHAAAFFEAAAAAVVGGARRRPGAPAGRDLEAPAANPGSG